MKVRDVYEGSDGDATKALYARLEALGTAGVVALNLFRASKCSARAKAYRGIGFKRDAYDRKNWSLGNLCAELKKSAAELGIAWGWKEDPAQEFHNWVLYIDIPTGQTSFHSATRLGCAQDYAGEWDGTGLSAERILTWSEILLGERELEKHPTSNAQHPTSDEKAVALPSESPSSRPRDLVFPSEPAPVFTQHELFR